jgi:general secretion pathway protein N
MTKAWPLIALGAGAYLAFALFTLPADIVLSRLTPAAVTTAGVSGTLWQGRAQVVQAGGLQLGSLEWDVHALALFVARLRADFKLTRTDGYAQGEVSLSPAGRVDLEQLSGSLPVGALPANVAPGGWTGVLNVKLAQLSIDEGWPTSAEGTLEALDLAGPASNPANIGSYKVAFPAEQAAGAGTLTGALSDLGGPLQISGKVQLSKDRSYLVEGLIAPRADAPVKVTRALEYLGPADAQGRRPFSFAGTF